MAARECARCGRPFEGRRDAKYHDDSCRAAAAKERAQSRSKPQRRRSTALSSAITRAVRSADLSKADAATVALAKVYARQIETDPTDADKLGPRLLQVLEQLHMTPKSRVTSTPPAARGGVVGDDGNPGDDKLDELRRRRDSRADRAAAVDSSPS